MKEMVFLLFIAYVGFSITPPILASEVVPSILPFPITEEPLERENYRAMRKYEIKKKSRKAAVSLARARATKKACLEKPEACRASSK